VKTVKQILAEMDDFSDEDRKRYLGLLLNKCTEVTEATLNSFQRHWDGRRPFEEFKAAQNKEIRECVKLELSEVGRILRDGIGMEPLTEDTEIG
jgi:hypothetical protein